MFLYIQILHIGRRDKRKNMSSLRAPLSLLKHTIHLYFQTNYAHSFFIYFINGAITKK